MGLEELVTSLEEAAERDADQRRSDARAEAERITAEAREGVKTRLETVLAAREAELRRDSERAVAQARRALRAEQLGRREALLAKVRELALGRLPGVLRSPEYGVALRHDLAEAVQFLGGRPGVMQVPPAVRKIAQEFVAETTELGLSDDPAPRSGPVLAALDGSLTIDLSLEAQLEARWEGLRQLVARWAEQAA